MESARELYGRELYGRELRYRLTLLLRGARRPMTVRELLAAFDGTGLAIGGRPSKTVSDALRWEIRRGRVRRTARSTYVTDHIPPSTVRYLQRWLVDRDALWERYRAA